MSEIEVGSEWRDDDSGLVARCERVKVVKVERYSVVIEAMDGELKGETWKLDRAWFLKKFSPLVSADAPPATPPHYDFAIEPIDAIRAWGLGFNLGNVVKYVARAGRKGPAIDDLRKARDYLDHEIRQIEGGSA